MRFTISRKILAGSAIALGLAAAGPACADSQTFKVPLTPDQCVPPVESSGSGSADLTYDSNSREVAWTITYSGLTSPVTMAHFHGPAGKGENASVVIWLTTEGSEPGNPITGKATLDEDQAKQFTSGEWYLNVHTKDNPACEIRGQVVPPQG
jgi:hypothetical protein